MLFSQIMKSVKGLAEILGKEAEKTWDIFRHKEVDELQEIRRKLRRSKDNDLKSQVLSGDEAAMDKLKQEPFDLEFLKSVEGFTTRGVIPRQNGEILGQSGVTIGVGIDLGQQDEKNLRLAQVPDEIIDKVKPYLGLRKEKAYEQMKQKPLRLSPEEAEVLSMKIIDYNDDKLENLFTEEAGVPFHSLPEEAQTVVRSVGHQYGDLKKRTPRFWGKIVSQDYRGAVDELRNFGDKYPTRRNKEADKLESIL